MEISTDETSEKKTDLLSSDLVVKELEKQSFSSNQQKQLRFSEMDFGRSKTSLRIRYEAEVELIRKKLGDLESIRESLGLSRRKMCQLLMVDPSAWTRWTNGTTKVPPHIYRALQWYLAINEKYPGLGSAYWLSSLANKEKYELKPEQKDLLKKELLDEIVGEIDQGKIDIKVNENHPQVVIQADEVYQETHEMLQILKRNISNSEGQLSLVQNENITLKKQLKSMEFQLKKAIYFLTAISLGFIICLLLIQINS